MSFSFGQTTDGRSSFSLHTSAAAPSSATTSSSASSVGDFSFGATAGGVSTPSGAPSSGFSFGAATSKAPAAPATSPGFGFGTTSGTSTSTATGPSASGFSVSGTSKAPSSGFSFSAPAKADTATSVTAATSAATATSVFGSGPKPVADEAKAVSGLNCTGAALKAPTLTTSATPSGFNFGATSGTPAPVAATSEGTKPTTMSSGFSFGGARSTSTAPAASGEESKSEATATSTVPSFGFGTSTAASGASGALTAATSTATTTAMTTSTTTATSSPVAETEKPPAEYMGRTIEDIINAWSEQLERNADTFTTEAVKVSKWDSDLLDSQRKLGDIAGDVRRIQVAQNELDSNLDTIFAYQMELKSTLEQLEKSVDKMYESQHQMPVAADIEREQALQLSVDLDDQLNSMTTTLKETVEKLNKAQDDAADENNPMVQIMKVLNVHHNSLQWIEGTTGRIDSEIAQLSSKLQNSSI